MLERHTVNTASGGGTSNSRYYQYNHRGDVVMVTDDNGAPLWAQDYTAFGHVASDDAGTWGGAGAVRDDLMITGKDWDEELGLYYFNARWYDPELGRFISQTPLAPWVEEAYVYCHNNPVMFLDFNGLEPMSTWGFIVEWGKQSGRVVVDCAGNVVGSVVGFGGHINQSVRANTTYVLNGRGIGNSLRIRDRYTSRHLDALGVDRVVNSADGIGQFAGHMAEYAYEEGAWLAAGKLCAGVIFTKQMLSGSVVIARGPDIGDVRRLIRTYGGRRRDWVKKKTWDALGNEWHWYECRGIGRVEIKPKW